MIHSYLLETKCEFLKLLRMPTYVIPTLLFPLMFYAFFGLAMGREAPPGSMPMARYLLATYGAFGVIGATLFGFGVSVAVERGLGWLQLKRASPMAPLAYFLAKGTVCLIFSAVIVTLLFPMGAVFGAVRMPATDWLLLGGALVLGSVPFCALGLAIGYLAGPNSAPAIVNLCYLPMSFCAGLWIPLQFLPHALQNIALALPAYHFAQIAIRMLHAPAQGSLGTHIEALAGFALVFAGIAWIAHSREREKMYG
jgi:ABC-2 type transport system permease protein